MQIEERKPEVIIFAGPNGSGKSTITKSVGTVLIDLIDLKEVKKNRPW